MTRNQPIRGMLLWAHIRCSFLCSIIFPLWSRCGPKRMETRLLSSHVCSQSCCSNNVCLTFSIFLQRTLTWTKSDKNSLLVPWMPFSAITQIYYCCLLPKTFKFSHQLKCREDSLVLHLLHWNTTEIQLSGTARFKDNYQSMCMLWVSHKRQCMTLSFPLCLCLHCRSWKM